MLFADEQQSEYTIASTAVKPNDQQKFQSGEYKSLKKQRHLNAVVKGRLSKTNSTGFYAPKRRNRNQIPLNSDSASQYKTVNQQVPRLNINQSDAACNSQREPRGTGNFFYQNSQGLPVENQQQMKRTIGSTGNQRRIRIQDSHVNSSQDITGGSTTNLSSRRKLSLNQQTIQGRLRDLPQKQSSGIYNILQQRREDIMKCKTERNSLRNSRTLDIETIDENNDKKPIGKLFNRTSQ